MKASVWAPGLYHAFPPGCRSYVVVLVQFCVVDFVNFCPRESRVALPVHAKRFIINHNRFEFEVLVFLQDVKQILQELGAHFGLMSEITISKNEHIAQILKEVVDFF